MSYPAKPDPHYDYASYQAAHPTSSPPGDQLDIDFAGLKAAVDETIDFISGSIASDGRVKASAVPGGEDLTAYVQTASTAATNATASELAASTSATAAAASAASAAGAAGSILATSTSSVAIGTGSKSFTTQPGKNFGVGAWLTIASDAAPTTNFMFGQITAYNTGTGSLTVNVTSTAGSGTHTDWDISLSGIQGVQGVKGDAGTPGSGGTDATGTVKAWHGRIGDIPNGWLPMNGAAVSRSTYSDLLALLVKSHTFTVTIASPAVVSWVGHGLDDGDPFVPSTDGALPTGLTAGATYYVKAVNANSFQLTDVPGGTPVVTTGSQSGTHTGVSALCGLGDGSTTFNTPDWRGAAPVGHDMMGSTAAGNLTAAGSGIYGRGRAVQGAENDSVVNVNHNHSYNSPTVTATAVTALGYPDGATPLTVVTAVGAISGGVTGSSGTTSQKYKRVGRVAPIIWMIKT